MSPAPGIPSLAGQSGTGGCRATVKRELDVGHRRWISEAEAGRDVFRWIAFYNHRRLHSALGYLSPADYEQTLTPTTLHQIAA